VLKIKDGGEEFHISKARLVGCGFSFLVSPIFLVFVAFSQINRGAATTALSYVLLTTLYIKRRVIQNTAFTATLVAVFVVLLVIAMQPRIETFTPIHIFLFVLIVGTIFMILVARLAELLFGNSSLPR